MQPIIFEIGSFHRQTKTIVTILILFLGTISPSYIKIPINPVERPKYEREIHGSFRY